MNKNTIGVFTGLAIVALGFVGYSTRDQWTSGTPQKVAEPSTAKVAEPEAPATQAAVEAEPAAPAQTAAAQPATAEAPAVAAAPAAEAEPPAQQQRQTAASEPAQPELPAAPAAAAEQPAAAAPEPAQPAERQVAAAEPSQPEVQAPAPAAEPAAPAEQQAAVQPEAAPAQPAAEAAPEQAPSFDTVRVEKSGEAVIAGTAQAGAEVVVKFDGEEIGATTANEDGAFVLVPEKPLPSGSGELTIESRGKGDLVATPSEQSVAVIVPAGAEDGALVAMMSPDAPTKVLQSPAVKEEPDAAAAPPASPAPEAAEAPAQPAAEVQPAPQPESQPETQVAAAPQPETQAQPEPVQPAPEAAAPAALPRVNIDAVDYDSAGNIVFSGQGTPGLTARIYVDNKYVGDAVTGADGRWSFSGTAEVAPGVHSLRVDGLDAAGKVASRIEVPFFREDQTKVAAARPEAPAAAAPTAPAAAETPPAEPPAAAAEPPAAPAPAAETPTPAEQPAAESGTVAAAPQPEAPAATTDVPAKQDQEVAAAAQPEQQAAAPAKPKEGRVVIQPGNNLWRISRVLYGSGQKYTMLYKANKDQIRNPNLIYPGQIFRTPEVAPMAETIDPKRRDPLKPEENAAAAP